MSERRGRHLLEGLELLPMRGEHTSDVARLHYNELSWSFNGQLGPEHVRELYEALVRSQFFFGYVIYRNGQLLGFVTATTDSDQMRSSIRRVYRGKLLQVAALMARHPSFLMGVLESLFVVPIVFKRYATKAEWLTFVTNTEVSYLTPLVAIKLIDAVRDHFHACGISTYVAQGVKQNPKAMRLYEKLGWEVAAKLLIHNIYVYRSNARDAATVLDKR
jgi:hypothetical protein